DQERRSKISLDCMLLAGEVNRAIGASGATEDFQVASFNVPLFWELFHHSVVDAETCTRFSEAVEKYQGTSTPDWPRDLPRSPFDLVHRFAFESNPPDFDAAEKILEYIRKNYRKLVPGAKRTASSPEGKKADDLPLSGTSKPPASPLGS
ncbi:MAG: hypothetical protein MUC63_04870, partial [Planctomycetes bacterium]|nr:hypothetical protein [Planctomycetota bacterium]